MFNKLIQNLIVEGSVGRGDWQSLLVVELPHLMILVILVIVTRGARLLPCRLSGLAEKQSLDTHVDDINTSGHQHHGQADQHTHRPDTPDSLGCDASPRRQDGV